MDKFDIGFIIVAIMMMAMMLTSMALSSEMERQTFNRLHHTDYGYWEWSFSKSIILDYTEGKQINVNLKNG